MRFLAAVAMVLTVFTAGPARAQYRQAGGAFSSPELDVRVIVLDSARGVAAASAEVVSGDCSGTLAGIGHVRGHSLTITPYEKLEGGESCKLSLQFDNAWDKVRVVGSECSTFSGTSCGFEGQSARRRDER
jgi:hypothetical protein